MSWNSVVEFHQTIRGNVDPESIRIGAEESCKMSNGWEKDEVKPKKEEHRATATKEKDVTSLRNIEKTTKRVGVGASEGNGDISKRGAKQVKNKKLATNTEKKNDRRVEARISELGGLLKDIGLDGESTKENDPQSTGKGGDAEFGNGFSNDLRGSFK
ncbi:hypothetical protein ONS95_011946 [Cadophora gregata]|uniref:uncharacterized protein n=1 Tax=Cadophora gregata TaxID=51156 RepID=UPI0026DB33D4|nr:uncharacterized protein ONS95_011946 [Cadophora gregata]KAK0117611.1 hypothetical protein ONS95_011946 [Cadophora gregata]KAK0122662.1 hypothetical protein ONS96_009700 [Cadophora gregata f. sp. sojae]